MRIAIKVCIIAGLGMLLNAGCYAQDAIAQRYGDQVATTSLKDNLTILASDAMEGRETAKRGQKMAAAFIRAHFETLKLQAPVNGSYYQTVELYTPVPGETYLQANGQRFNNFAEIAHYGLGESGGEIAAPLVFAGFGTESDLAQVDVKDKAVLMFCTSGWLPGHRDIQAVKARGARAIFVSNTDTAEEFAAAARDYETASRGNVSLRKPVLNLNQKGGLFIISPAAVEKVMGVSIDKLRKAATDSKAALKKIKPVSITYKISTTIDVVTTENVLGYLEGSDKKDELVVVTAHYDHIGLNASGNDRVNNGADDDGSGTVTVMELAKVFAQAKKDGHGPRRSILFMTVSGEEKGLLGSDYYTQHPVFPLSSTVVDLNIDMIGRRDKQHMSGPPYLYVIGDDKLSTALHELSEQVNQTYTRLTFDYTYNDPAHPERLYYRSDHWNFAKNNIPVIFYFDGIHEDYHGPDDEVDKIDFELLAKRAQCIFYTAWEIANRDARIVPDKK